MQVRLVVQQKQIDEALGQWTIQEVTHFRNDDLLIFVDDTGHEDLAAGHSVYGLGGVAMIGERYKRLRREWIAIKNLGQQEFGVPVHVPFHATRHMNRGIKQRRVRVKEFMRAASFTRFARFVDSSTLADENASFVEPVLRGLVGQVAQLMGENYRRVWWIFELSQRQSRRMVASMMQDGYSLAYPGRMTDSKANFMNKARIEPGLGCRELP